MKADSCPQSGQELLSFLRRRAEGLGLIGEGAEVSPTDVFQLIRDMPYMRASSRQPVAIISEWRGTCSGKHYLLNDLLQAMGFEVRIFMCTHNFTHENSENFPATLRAHLADGPVPDVHTYLLVRLANATDGGKWTRLDATWPASAAKLGMTVNCKFEIGVDMRLACEPTEHFEVPGGEDPQSFKEDLIRKHCGTNVNKRELLINGLGDWLGQATS